MSGNDSGIEDLFTFLTRSMQGEMRCLLPVAEVGRSTKMRGMGGSLECIDCIADARALREIKAPRPRDSQLGRGSVVKLLY